MAFGKSAYSRLENIVAVLVCIASPIIFGLLYHFGFMAISDFYLSIMITIGLTALNVSMTWVAVHFFLQKRRSRKKKKR